MEPGAVNTAIADDLTTHWAHEQWECKQCMITSSRQVLFFARVHFVPTSDGLQPSSGGLHLIAIASYQAGSRQCDTTVGRITIRTKRPAATKSSNMPPNRNFQSINLAKSAPKEKNNTWRWSRFCHLSWEMQKPPLQHCKQSF